MTPEVADVDLQIMVVNDVPGPHMLEELPLTYDFTRPSNEQGQDIEGSSAEVYGLAFVEQRLSPRKQPEIPKNERVLVRAKAISARHFAPRSLIIGAR